MSQQHTRYRWMLDRWLTRTTAMLCDDAKETVRREIEGHVAEAVERYTGEGMSERDAWDAAVRDLGSPVDAYYAFNSTYMSILDDKNLRPYLTRVLAPSTLFSVSAVFHLISLLLFAATIYVFTVFVLQEPNPLERAEGTVLAAYLLFIVALWSGFGVVAGLIPLRRFPQPDEFCRIAIAVGWIQIVIGCICVPVVLMNSLHVLDEWSAVTISERLRHGISRSFPFILGLLCLFQGIFHVWNYRNLISKHWSQYGDKQAGERP